MRISTPWMLSLCLAIVLPTMCPAQDQLDDKLSLVLPDIQFRATPLKRKRPVNPGRDQAGAWAFWNWAGSSSSICRAG